MNIYIYIYLFIYFIANMNVFNAPLLVVTERRLLEYCLYVQCTC